MKTIAISFLLLVLPAFLLADDKKDPELVKVYCFSEQMEAGFEDVPAMSFCQHLNKRGTKKKSLTRVNVRDDDADVVIHFVEADTVTKRGESTFINYGLAWTPDETLNRRSVIVSVGSFAKPFSAEGVNAQATGRLVRKVEEWIRNNRENILEKAKAQQ